MNICSKYSSLGYQHLAGFVAMMMATVLVFNSSHAAESSSDAVNLNAPQTKFSVYARDCSRSAWESSQHKNLKLALESLIKFPPTGHYFISTGNRPDTWNPPSMQPPESGPTSCSICDISGTEWKLLATTKLASDAKLLTEALRKAGKKVEVIYHYPVTKNAANRRTLR